MAGWLDAVMSERVGRVGAMKNVPDEITTAEDLD